MAIMHQNRSFKVVNFYYSLVIFLMTFVLAAGAYYHWFHGTLNINRIEKILISYQQLEKISPDNFNSEMLGYLDNVDIRSAMKKFEVFEKSMLEFDDLQRNQENFKSILKDTILVKNLLSEMMEIPALDQLLQVNKTKITDFHSFVKSNGWKTLTRMSDRQISIIPDIENKKSYSVLKRIKYFREKTIDNLDRMEKIARESSLQASDKAAIAQRLNGVRVEIGLISKLLVQIDKIYEHYRSIHGQFILWKAQFAPALIQQRLIMADSSRSIFIGLMSVVVAGICFLFLGHLIFQISLKRSKSQFEISMLNLLKETLIQKNWDAVKGFSQDFQEKFRSFRDYMSKRMSLGQILNDSFPFPTLLLDDGLFISWANDHFYQMWQIDQNRPERLHWDHFNRYTNLEQSDAIDMALSQSISGIYQIQVRPPQQENSIPYEMYVNVVEHGKQKKILVVFYPLKSLEQSLSYQAKSLVAPVIKVLNALLEGKFRRDFSERIKKDFDIAGINEVYDKFQQYHGIVYGQNERLISEISGYESLLNDQYKFLLDLKNLQGREIEVYNRAIKSIQEQKNILIQSAESRFELESNGQKSLNISKTILKDAQDLWNRSNVVTKNLQEQKQSFSMMIDLRKEFKVIRDKMEGKRQQLLHKLDQLMVFGILSKDSDHAKKEAVKNDLAEIKNEVRSWDGHLLEMTKLLTKLDVSMSRMEIVQQHIDDVETIDIQQKWTKYRNELEEFSFKINKISNQLMLKDEEIVQKLKNDYECWSNVKTIVIESGQYYQTQYDTLHALATQDTETNLRAKDGSQEEKKISANVKKKNTENENSLSC